MVVGFEYDDVSVVEVIFFVEFGEVRWGVGGDKVGEEGGGFGVEGVVDDLFDLV